MQPGNGATTSLSDTIGITVPSGQSVSAFAAQHTGNGNALDAGKTMAYALRRTTTGGATTTLATITLAADGSTVRGQTTFATIALLAGEVLTVTGTPSALLTAAVTDIMASAGGPGAGPSHVDYVLAVDITLPNSTSATTLATAANITAGFALPTIVSTTTTGRAQLTRIIISSLTNGAGSAFYQIRLTAPDTTVTYGVWSSANVAFDSFALTQAGTYTIAIFYFCTSTGVFACNASSSAPGATASISTNSLRLGGPVFST